MGFDPEPNGYGNDRSHECLECGCKDCVRRYCETCVAHLKHQILKYKGREKMLEMKLSEANREVDAWRGVNNVK